MHLHYPLSLTTLPGSAMMLASPSARSGDLLRLSPSRRESVARIVSPETRLPTSPSSKATSLLPSAKSRGYYPGQIPSESGATVPSRPRRFAHRKRREFSWDEKSQPPERPRSVKSWIASRTDWEPHPNERAIREARSPLLLARMIWARRMTKASLERRAVSKCSF
jgi:hypothetical protein